MSNNLIIGLAIGYPVERIQNFVLSLRQYYDGDVLFVIDSEDPAMLDFFNKNNIYSMTLEEQINVGLIGFERWEIYKDVINDHFPDVERVLTSDVRDVVFQGNPFDHFTDDDLQFSTEPIKIGECTIHNAKWIKDIYGDEVLDEVKDNVVLCAGVVGGTKEGILKLCDLIIEEGQRLKEINKLTFTDQASLNVLYGQGKCPESTLHLTGDDAMATMHHAKTLTFDREGYLLSNNGNKIAMVHQYDRCGFSGLNFIKNALQVKGVSGMRFIADYAARNVPDHDLT
jgi:hypothetical protein